MQSFLSSVHAVNLAGTESTWECSIPFLTVHRPEVQPVPEKPQRPKMMTMGTKRVLDESALVNDDGEDDDDNNNNNSDEMTQQSSNMLQHDDEPIDVFNMVRSPLRCLFRAESVTGDKCIQCADNPSVFSIGSGGKWKF